MRVAGIDPLVTVDFIISILIIINIINDKDSVNHTQYLSIGIRQQKQIVSSSVSSVN